MSMLPTSSAASLLFVWWYKVYLSRSWVKIQAVALLAFGFFSSFVWLFVSHIWLSRYLSGFSNLHLAFECCVWLSKMRVWLPASGFQLLPFHAAIQIWFVWVGLARLRQWPGTGPEQALAPNLEMYSSIQHDTHSRPCLPPNPTNLSVLAPLSSPVLSLFTNPRAIQGNNFLAFDAEWLSDSEDFPLNMLLISNVYRMELEHNKDFNLATGSLLLSDYCAIALPQALNNFTPPILSVSGIVHTVNTRDSTFYIDAHQYLRVYSGNRLIRVYCMFPDTKRFENNKPMPSQNSYAHVTGIVSRYVLAGPLPSDPGVHRPDVEYFVLEIDNITFLGRIPLPKAESSEASSSAQVSPAKRGQLGFFSGSPSKKPRTSASQPTKNKPLPPPPSSTHDNNDKHTHDGEKA
ncbi:hypothetical protein BDZ89DRAFT_1049155 [Hymenopellis radicata]|nr:hypothetical protein BDZ89DRAFT_1049155 [Hymenopellis radicata]